MGGEGAVEVGPAGLGETEVLRSAARLPASALTLVLAHFPVNFIIGQQTNRK